MFLYLCPLQFLAHTHTETNLRSPSYLLHTASIWDSAIKKNSRVFPFNHLSSHPYYSLIHTESVLSIIYYELFSNYSEVMGIVCSYGSEQCRSGESSSSRDESSSKIYSRFDLAAQIVPQSQHMTHFPWKPHHYNDCSSNFLISVGEGTR